MITTCHVYGAHLFIQMQGNSDLYFVISLMEKLFLKQREQ